MKLKLTQNVRLLITVLIFAMVGTITLVISRASTPNVTLEGEDGNKQGPVCNATDSSASVSKAVKFGCNGTPAYTVSFPADSGAIFLADAPYNMKCDGQVANADANTAAIQSALDTYAKHDLDANNFGKMRYAFRTLVLPAGTCMVSNTIAAPGCSIRLVGAGQDNTTLRLKDGAAGYGSAGTPKYIYKSGEDDQINANSGFGNYVQDLTIDAGANNPGAVGLRFDGSNSAAVERVTIKAGTGSGLRGMAFETAPGSLQVQDTKIEGFAVGIWTDENQVNNLVFNNLTLTNQRTVAIQNNGKSLQFEGLTVSGTPKVYDANGSQAVAEFVDVNLTGPGTGTALDINNSDSYIYARNISASGWSNLITIGSTDRFVGKTTIAEWGSANFWRGDTSVAWTETSPVASLNLAHPAAPYSTDYNLSHWTKATPTSGNNNDDDAPAIQAAIDSGAKVIYLPYGEYTIKTPVIVRGNVEKIDFFGSRIIGANSGKISIGTSSAAFVQLVNASAFIKFEQNGPNKVVLENMAADNDHRAVATTGLNASGDLFLENFGGGNVFDINKPINVYIRQLNREGGGSEISNGGRVWIFGDNLEMHDEKGNPFLEATDSTLEIVSGAMDNLATLGRFNSDSDTSQPIYNATNSHISIMTPGVFRSGAITGHPIRDTGSGRDIHIKSSQLLVDVPIGQWRRIVLPLYVSP